MKKTGIVLGGLILCVLFFCSPRFVLKDFEFDYDPAWKSFRGDLRNSGYIQDEIPTPEKLLWKIELNGRVEGTAVVAKDVVFVGDLHRKVYFVDAHSGKRLSELSLKQISPTFLSIDDGFLYLSSDGKEATLFCFNLKRGKIEWRKELGSSRSSPLIKGDRIFLGTESGKFYALKKSSAQPVWQFDAKRRILTSPAYSQGLLYFGSDDGWFYALVEKTGGVRWKFKAEKGIHSSPAVQGNKVVFGALDGFVYCLNKDNGDLIWNFKTSGSIYSSPAVTESSLFIGSNDGFLYGIDLLSGELIWKFETPSPIHSSPLVVGDRIFFGSLDGKFYALDRSSGSFLWSYETGGMITSSPAYYKGRIYIGSEDGYLYCFGN
jgi:outer membrane protein assembly factor BamB